MTILVGVKCTDGVVIGADSVATSAAGPQSVMQIQSNDKIRIFDGKVICAATGAIGLAQRLRYHVHAAAVGGVFTNLSVHEAAGNISKRFLTDCANTLVARHPQRGIQFGALIAVHIKGEARLIEYASIDFQPEIKEDNLFYVSMGSGQHLADPFLAFVSRVLWRGKQPTVDEAKFGVYWALDHTIKLAPGGIGEPIHVATLRDTGGAWAAQEMVDTQEAAQFISELESHIGEFAMKPAPGTPVEVPPTPPLPPMG